MIKRIFDFVVGLMMVVFFAPVLLVCYVFHKIFEGGKFLFIHFRIGLGGKLIPIYKIRTMYENSDEILAQYLESSKEAREHWEMHRKLKDFDPRVFRYGEILRRLDLDELPQLFNVLKGDLSLVGPRPYMNEELDPYPDEKAVITSVKPGISGLWQVSGRNKLTLEERIALDVEYAKNRTFWMDLTILLVTIYNFLAQFVGGSGISLKKNAGSYKLTRRINLAENELGSSSAK